MAKETKIINKPEISIPDTVTTTVTGDVSIDDSTPIDTAITGTPNVSVTNTPAVTVSGAVAANSTIQNATLAVTKSGTWAVDSVGGTVTTNATIQNATLATKGKTSYSDTTTNVDYWLGLYNDNQLIKKSAVVSATEISTTATFQSTAVDAANAAIQINEFLDGSGNVTGRSAQVVTWTQANEDLSLPAITSIALGSPGSIVTGSVEDVAIGTLSAVGATGAIEWTIVNAGGLDTIKLVGAIMKSGSGGITDTAGTFTVSVKAVDSIGKERTSDVTVTVESSYSNTKYINNGSWLRSNFTIKDVCGEDDVSNVLVRSDKPWTINIWMKAGLAYGGSSSQSWTGSHSAVWSCNRGDWVMVTTTGTGYNGIYMTVYSDKVYIYSHSDGSTHLAGYTTSLDDTSWYMVTVTNTPVDTLGDTWHFDIEEDVSYTKGLTVYINGVRDARTAYHTSSTDNQSLTSNKFMVGGGPENSYCKNFYFDEFSIHNTTKSSSEVVAMYNSGSSTDLSSDSSTKVWVKADNLATGITDLADGEKVANDGGTYEVESDHIGSPSGGYVEGTVVEY